MTLSTSKHQTDEYRLLWLAALEDAGVDNWEGFDEAIKPYKEFVKDFENDEENV